MPSTGGRGSTKLSGGRGTAVAAAAGGAAGAGGVEGVAAFGSLAPATACGAAVGSVTGCARKTTLWGFGPDGGWVGASNVIVGGGAGGVGGTTGVARRGVAGAGLDPVASIAGASSLAPSP